MNRVKLLLPVVSRRKTSCLLSDKTVTDCELFEFGIVGSVVEFLGSVGSDTFEWITESESIGKNGMLCSYRYYII